MTITQRRDEATGNAATQLGLSDQALVAFVESSGGAGRGAGSAALRAACYHLESGGKRARAELALQAGSALGIPDADNLALAATVELLHNSSLVFDDLQDKDTERRGTPAVWVKFGAEVALCTGALMLSAAYGALSTLSDGARIGPLVAHTHLRTSLLIHGQTADLAVSAHTGTTLREYEQVAAEKSGVLFALPIELALLYAGCEHAVPQARRAAHALAIGYQIADDLEDLESDLAASSGAGRLNYVMLANDRSGAGGISLARERALELLHESIALAEDLPHGAGAPLQELARRFAARI
ncbi:polyprenyl synthetase family protein [bacterium]|nr:polyprenyl synthetase family protein [bacterium]